MADFKVLQHRDSSWEWVAKIIRETYPKQWTCGFLKVRFERVHPNSVGIFVVSIEQIKDCDTVKPSDYRDCIPITLIPGGSLTGKDLHDHCLTWIEHSDPDHPSFKDQSPNTPRYIPDYQYGPCTWNRAAEILCELRSKTANTHVIIQQKTAGFVFFSITSDYPHIKKPTGIITPDVDRHVIFPISYIDGKQLQIQYNLGALDALPDKSVKLFKPIISAEVYNVKRFRESILESETIHPTNWWEYETFVQCKCGNLLTSYDTQFEEPLHNIAQRAKTEDEAIENAKAGLSSLELSDLFLYYQFPDECPDCGQVLEDYELTEKDFTVMIRDDADYDERYSLDEVKTMLPDVKVELEGKEYTAGTRGSLLDKATLVIEELNDSSHQADWKDVHQFMLTGKVIELG